MGEEREREKRVKGEGRERKKVGELRERERESNKGNNILRI